MPMRRMRRAIRRSCSRTRRCGRGAGRRCHGPSCGARSRRWRPRCAAGRAAAATGSARSCRTRRETVGGVPRLREPRRGLVGVLARHGAGRGARPLPADRAEGADRLRRLYATAASRTTGARCSASWSTGCRACAHVVAAAATSSRGADAAAGAPRLRAASTTSMRCCATTRPFEPAWLPFDHPLWVVYSSGTTGLAESRSCTATAA